MFSNKKSNINKYSICFNSDGQNKFEICKNIDFLIKKYFSKYYNIIKLTKKIRVVIKKLYIG